MINPKGQVKLLDFGIAKNTDKNSAEYTQTSTSQQMGTPMYMSPEQVNETKSVTAQSDIYSLGVVLWQMVMGQKPYDTKALSNFQLQSKIVNEKLALTHTIWDTSIQKATHKKLNSRYTSAQLFLNDLQNPKSIKDDKTIFENKDDKTIFENKEEATIIENSKAQNSNTTKTQSKVKALGRSKAKVKTEKANQNLAVNSTNKNSKSKLGIVISVIIFILGIGGLLIFKNLVKFKSMDEVTIGRQIWTAKNLDVETYRNGDAIPQVQDPFAWANLTTGAWCYYENKTANGSTYGKLYNWYAVTDTRSLAPEGYHIPNEAEGNTLSDYLGGEEIAGAKMKSTNVWDNNGNGTNASGFSGLPGGARLVNGDFKGFGEVFVFWRLVEDGGNDGGTCSIDFDDGALYFDFINKHCGFSVRCIKD
jgi:uncharacterized protein (TIGR02145 family)